MGTIKTPMRLVGSYFDPAKIESVLGGTKVQLLRVTAALADPFSDNVLDLAKWNETDSAANVNEQNGRLEIKGSGAWNVNGIVSKNAATSSGDVLIELTVVVNVLASSYVMCGLSTSATLVYTGIGQVYLNSDGKVWVLAQGINYSTGLAYVNGTAYTFRWRRQTGQNLCDISIQGGAYTVETKICTCVWAWGTNWYFQMQQYGNTTASYFSNFTYYNNGGYDATSPPIYSVMDSGVAASTWDMSTFTDRGDNVNGETGSVKYKYFMSDTLYDPTNAGDRATIIAGLNASWLTEAQMQAEADQTGRYRYLAEELISDGTQECSEVEASDLQDVILPAAAGGGGAWVF